MTKLTYEARENHLEKNEEVKEKWEHLTSRNKEIKKAIWIALTSREYNNFEKIKSVDWDTGEVIAINRYEDSNLRWFMVQLRLARGTQYNKQNTIDEAIMLIKEVKALQKTLDHSSIQMKREELLAQRDSPSTCYRNERGEGNFDFFKEERIEKELNALKEQENQESWREQTEEKYDDNNEEYEEEEPRPESRINNYYDN